MTEFEHVTTNAVVEIYNSSNGIFESLLKEVKVLSQKKPDATMSPGKVMIINRVLEDLLTFLSDEPSGKYLDVLDDQTLPQTSDAVLMMVQFESALASFNQRYHKFVSSPYYWMDDTHYWITKEQLAKWEEEKEERLANGEEEEEEDGG